MIKRILISLFALTVTIFFCFYYNKFQRFKRENELVNQQVKLTRDCFEELLSIHYLVYKNLLSSDGIKTNILGRSKNLVDTDKFYTFLKEKNFFQKKSTDFPSSSLKRWMEDNSFTDPNNRKYHVLIEIENITKSCNRADVQITVWGDGVNKKNDHGSIDDIVIKRKYCNCAIP